MTELVWNRQILTAEYSLRLDIREMTTVQGENGVIFVAAGGHGGGLLSIAATQDGGRLLHEVRHGAGDGGLGDFGLSLVQTEAGLMAVTGSGPGDTLRGRVIDSATGRFTQAEVTVDGGIDSAVATTLNGVLYAASDDRGLTWHRVTQSGAADGAFATGSGLARDMAGQLGEVVDMAALAGANGRPDMLLTLSRDGGGLNAFTLDGNGTPRAVDAMGPQNGLGLHDEPLALETVTLRGVAHAVILSASSTGAGAALSVVSVTTDGSLTVTDHILDSRDTRFGHATELATAEVDGRTYVLVGGADGGLSLFAISPGGQLVHLDTLEDTQTALLGSISALEMAAVGDSLAIMAASESDYGLIRLSFDLSDQGVTRFLQDGSFTGTGRNDLIEGGWGDNRLAGGGGQDTLIDGIGEDRLTGGAGRDTFVLVADGTRDVITDFTAGVDRIDLSRVPMLYGPERLEITRRAWGAEVRWGNGDVLELRSADGRALSEAQVLAAFDWTIDRPPLIVTGVTRGGGAADTLEAPDDGGILLGLGGADSLLGGTGDDRLEGGTGNDSLRGGAGNDTVVGGAGYDMAWLGAGNDTFEPGEDGYGSRDHDRVSGEGGNDVISGGGGNDSLWGGTGADLLRGDDGLDHLIGGTGADTLHGGAGADTLEGGDDADLLQGDAGNDRLSGGMQFDTLHGGTGNDTVDGGLGRDLAWLGEGDDVFLDAAQGGPLGNDTVWAGLGNDSIRGDMGWDTFHGEGGSDTIFGGWGNDTITGGDGNDSLHGGLHDDRLDGDEGSDTLDGFAGHDLIFGGAGNDRVFAGAQYDTVHAGAGNDTVFGGNGRDLVYLNEGNDVFHDDAQGGEHGRDTVFAGAGNDIIQGGNGNDVFHGEAGADLIHGRLGNDLIRGGDQRDTIHAGEGNDTVDGGNGRDLIFLNQGDDSFRDNAEGGASGADTVFAGFGNDTIQGGGGNDVFHGQHGNDVIRGGAGDDVIHGGNDNDTLYAGEGNDTVHGGDGRDLVYLHQGDDLFHDTGQGGELGRDTVFAGLGNDTIEGGNGDDAFYGEGGDDLIRGRLGRDILGGGAGRDTLNGGWGRDTLTGGDGADTFVFVAGDAGTDIVTDFELGSDRVFLSREGAVADLGFTYNGRANEVTLTNGDDAFAVLRSTGDLSDFGLGDIGIW